MEGLLLGGVGAALALILVWAFYAIVGRTVGADVAGVIGEGGLQFLGLTQMLFMLGGGLGVGAAAGALASRAVK